MSPAQQMAAGKASNIMSQIIIGDEAIFQVNRNVTNHNVVCYAPCGGPPEEFVYDKPSSGEELVVWIRLVRKNLVGPNVNGQAYLEMLKNFVLPQAENIIGVNQNWSWPRAYWLQDGASGHRLNGTKNQFDMYSFVSELWCAFWQKNDAS